MEVARSPRISIIIEPEQELYGIKRNKERAKYVMLNFIKGVFSSKTALIFILVNIILWAYVLWERGGLKQPLFHFYYESWLLILLFIINMPAVIISGFILIPLTFAVFGLSTGEENLIGQIVIILLASCFQWAVIGYWVEFLLFRKKREALR